MLQTHRFAEMLRQKFLQEHDARGELLSEKLMDELRIASILHDCAHGPFSHTSEEVYRYHDEAKAAQKMLNESLNVEACPHETLAWLIVTSDPFRKFFDDLKVAYGFDAELNEIAGMIIGVKSRADAYKTQLLNGPFDADKIDYIFRDSHFSGIPLNIDLDRLWYCADIAEVEKRRRLVVNPNGATSLEQILISKMVLFTTIYQHHKVRTCDSMFKALFEYLNDNPNSKLHKRRFEVVLDFLETTDGTLLADAETNQDSHLRELLQNLLDRNLLKRALVISQSTVEGAEDSRNWQKFTELANPTPENAKMMRRIAVEIWRQAKKPCSKYQVWLDVPKLPSLNSANYTFVRQPGEDAIRLTELFPMGPWAKQYGQHAWKAHVFAPASGEIRGKINKAAKEVLEGVFGIKFKPLASSLCHL
jgi:HD superfamily phosphohydrolase